MKDYLWNILEALSQLLNAVLGGNPNITVSANAYLKRDKNPLSYRLINKIFWWQEDHCKQSWVSDIIFARIALFELEVPKQKPTE